MKYIATFIAILALILSIGAINNFLKIKANIEYNTAAEAGYTKDYTFTADKFTNNQREMTLENVRK